MVIAFEPKDLSKKVVVDIFKKGLQAAVISGDYALTDPAGTNRPDKSKFIVTSMPTTDVYYPHIVVEESDASGSRLDTRQSKLMNYKFQITITIRAKSNTHIFAIKDGIREWLQKAWGDIKDAGYADLKIQGGGPTTWDTTSLVKEAKIIINGNTYTTGE